MAHSRKMTPEGKINATTKWVRSQQLLLYDYKRTTLVLIAESGAVMRTVRWNKPGLVFFSPGCTWACQSVSLTQLERPAAPRHTWQSSTSGHVSVSRRRTAPPAHFHESAGCKRPLLVPDREATWYRGRRTEIDDTNSPLSPTILTNEPL